MTLPCQLPHSAASNFGRRVSLALNPKATMQCCYFKKHCTASVNKNSKKMHTNLNKCQVENCPTLPGRNSISTGNRRAKSVPAGRVEISSWQTKIMQLQDPGQIVYAGVDATCMSFSLTADKSYSLVSVMERLKTFKRPTSQKKIKGTVMQIKNNCQLVAAGLYPETFAFQLFIFLCLFFRETFEFPKKQASFLKIYSTF